MTRFALTLVLLAAAVAAAPGSHPAPKTLGPVETYGANLQRSTNLMAGSTGLKRNTVRVLFYGQSITAADWTKIVGERLRRQYPLTDFVIENRAIPGFHASLLVKTAEADLYPFYPDLVIFHDYGEPKPIEDMIRRLRERTTADILIATDHVAPLLGEKLPEETDPFKLRMPKAGEPDAAWRSRVFLPSLAKKYGAELADVRSVWTQYLADHKLSPSDLLFDDLHLNDRGNFLMSEIILAHLRHRPDLTLHFDDRRVRTFVVGEDVNWKDGKLVLPFHGNRVELICREGATPGEKPAAIRIDGKKPSEFPELYGFTRTESVAPLSYIPPLLCVRSEKALLAETWTMDVSEIANGGAKFRFRIAGSITGDDGAGESGARFVSKSGRVVLEADDFGLSEALKASREPGATSAKIQWKVATHFADEFVMPKRNPFGDTVAIAAQGLANGKHILEITGNSDTPLAAIRVYRPGN